MINTICIMVGSYRNLTTLTSATLMLHPEVQVVNHKYSFNENCDTDFLVSYSKNKVDNFIKKIIEIAGDEVSVSGDGGVISKSHAFLEHKIMRDVFNNRYSNTDKKNVKSIIWKESHRNTNLIRKNDVNLLISKDSRFRFFLPIRNPMDCAMSNMNGYKKYFGADTESKEDVMRGLFEIYSWFFDLQKKYPKRFMYLFENDFKENLLKLENFLKIQHNKDWYKDVNDVWELKNNYKHEQDFINLYKSLVSKLKDDYIKDKFNIFLNN